MLLVHQRDLREITRESTVGSSSPSGRIQNTGITRRKLFVHYEEFRKITREKIVC
jgi:hypothetical protein